MILRLFLLTVIPTSAVFPNKTLWQYSDRDFITGASNASGVWNKKLSYRREGPRRSVSLET